MNSKKKRNNVRLLVILTAVSLPKLTYADFEIWSGSFGNFSAVSQAGSVSIQSSLMGNSTGTGVLFGIPNPSLGYHWNHGIEFFFSPSYNFVLPLRTFADQPVNPSTLVSQITTGVGYHFSEERNQSFFVRFDLGIAVLKSGDAVSTNFLWDFRAGKKFTLGSGILWVPSLMFQMVSTVPNSSIGLALVPLEFAISL